MPTALEIQLKEAVADGNLALAQELLSQMSLDTPKPKATKATKKKGAAKPKGKRGRPKKETAKAETPKRSPGRPKKTSSAKPNRRLESDDPARYDQILEEEDFIDESDDDSIDIEDYTPSPSKKTRLEDQFAMPKKADFADKTRAKSISLVKKNRKMTFLSGETDKVVDKETGKTVLGADKKTKAVLARTNDEALWDGLEPSERREAAKKIKVKCRDCSRPFLVYASQLTPSVDADASEQAYKFFYRCPDCGPAID